MYDGFDNPIGPDPAGARVWPANWLDVNPIGTQYELGYHTGADLNLPGDGDAHAPVYAVAGGTVIYAQVAPGTWGNLIVIEHAMPDGAVFSRYGHVENLQVSRGQAVKRGQVISHVGNAFDRWAFHLHFDISTHPTRLRQEPYDWSAWSREQVLSIYTDPKAYIAAHRPPAFPPNALWVTAKAGLRLRRTPGLDGTIMRVVPYGTPVQTGMIWTNPHEDILWTETTLLTGEIGWMAIREGDNLYLSRQKPQE